LTFHASAADVARVVARLAFRFALRELYARDRATRGVRFKTASERRQWAEEQ
jgi:hypothetical protein